MALFGGANVRFVLELQNYFFGKVVIRYQLILQTTLTPLFTRTLHICTNLNMLLGGCPVKGQKGA
jgi:hypothetical protein